MEELRAALHATPRRPARAALVSNRDGALLGPERADEIPDRLAEQIARPMAWTRSLAALAALGAGAVLRGLVRKNLPGARVHGTQDTGDLARTPPRLARIGMSAPRPRVIERLIPHRQRTGPVPFSVVQGPSLSA